MGDTVNVASRLESLTKETGDDILIGAPTYERVRHAVEVGARHEFEIRGRAEPVVVYSVKGLKQS